MRTLRGNEGYTLERLSSAAGISLGTLALIEQSKANPTWTTLRKLCQALGLTMADLGIAVEEERDTRR